MKIAFDESADALYIQFQSGKTKKTIKLRDGFLMDIDPKGRVLGLEILDVRSRISLKDLRHLDINLPVHA